MMTRFSISALLMLCMIHGAFSQPSIERSVVASGGGTYTNGSSLALDYTIGEPVVTTVGNINNILTQGFQQPFSSVQVNINENPQPDMDVSFWPNPVINEAEVNVRTNAGAAVVIRMYDLLGRIICEVNEKADSEGVLKSEVDVKAFAPGYYLLKISSGEVNTTLKILKKSS